MLLNNSVNKLIHLVIGARPNYMKVAPLFHSLKLHQPKLLPLLVETGQHFDFSMSDTFLNDFNLPKPHFQLDIGQGTPIEQTAKIMTRYETICLEQRPDLTIVVGDVNSTLAIAIAAKKMNIPLAHLEAGLRSFDRRMPEEVNRVLTAWHFPRHGGVVIQRVKQGSVLGGALFDLRQGKRLPCEIAQRDQSIAVSLELDDVLRVGGTGSDRSGPGVTHGGPVIKNFRRLHGEDNDHKDTDGEDIEKPSLGLGRISGHGMLGG